MKISRSDYGVLKRKIQAESETLKDKAFWWSKKDSHSDSLGYFNSPKGKAILAISRRLRRLASIENYLDKHVEPTPSSIPTVTLSDEEMLEFLHDIPKDQAKQIIYCKDHTHRQFDKYGYFRGIIPAECVAECSHPGPCDSDVAKWVNILGFKVIRSKAIPWLLEYGAWNAKELKAMTILELSEIVLWIACGDIKENREWFGLV